VIEGHSMVRHLLMFSRLLQDGCLSVRVCGQMATFDKFVFEAEAWYHIAVVHVRHRMRYSAITLYVNGLPVQVGLLNALLRTALHAALNVNRVL
jgi:hypothetical protein